MPEIEKLTQRVAFDLVQSGKAGKWGEKNNKLKLKVYPSGEASWVFRHAGRETVIGQFSAIDLAHAKQEAASIELKLRAGEDPITKRQLARTQISDEHLTLRAGYNLFCKLELPSKSPRYQQDYIHEFEKYILPKFGNRPFFEITRDDVIAFIDPHRIKRPSIAKRLIAYLSRLYNWLSNRPGFSSHYNDRFINPARRVEKPIIKERSGYLLPEEMRRIWDACDLLPNPYSAACVRLLIITGKRTVEAREMRSTHLDFQSKVWTIPNPKSGDLEDKVPLTERAFELISEVNKNNGPYVFSANGGFSPIYTDNKLKLRLQAASGVSGKHCGETGWTFHDFRRSIKSSLTNLGCPLFVSEAILGHKNKGLERVYNLADLLEQKRHWLQKWEEQVFNGS